MKITGKQKKWKRLIICIWLLSLLIAGIGCTVLQRANVYKKIKTELLDQANVISGQFDRLVDTNFYTRAALQDRKLAEVRAISFFLESCNTIDDARSFLEDIVNNTEIKKLWIFDRSGNAVFSSGAAPADKPYGDLISSLLDSKAYEAAEDTYTGDDRYWTTTYYMDKETSSLFWGVKDRWLVYAEDVFSEPMKEVVKFFDWEHVLQEISIGRDGAALAVSVIDGSVLSFADSSFKGKPVEALKIMLAGNKEPASVHQLVEAFSHTGEVSEIEVDSVRYYATRMNIDHDLFLVMFPVSSLEREVAGESFVLLLPLALITGIGAFYAFCLAANHVEQSQENSGLKGPAILIGKLKLFAILGVALMLILSLYMETHLVYASMFRYTSTTADDVLQKRIEADTMLQEIHTYLEVSNLEKCKIARCVVQHTSPDKVDRQYISDLAGCLNTNYIYIFTKQGKVAFTNAPYDGYVIDADSPFHALLEGEESVTLQPDQEKTDETVQQFAGVTMLDESKRVAGAVLIEDSTISKLSENISFEAVFQRVFLKDNTILMAVNSENMAVYYFAQVQGAFLRSDRLTFDYTQADAAALGIDEALIRDHFNGEMFAVDNRFFASVRRSDNAFLMVLFPLVFIDADNLVSVLFVTAAIVLFFILLICVTSKYRSMFEEADLSEDTQPEGNEEKSDRSFAGGKRNEDKVIALLENLADNKKTYFEERWPYDGKQWGIKTPMEKFYTVVKIIFVGVLALIVGRALIAGESSIWYYCFHGEWNSGINLYSITSCIITVIVLILLQQVIHKILYLIARAAKRRGESICHLLNSFSGYVLFIAGIFIVLGILGVNLTAMSLTAGVAGVIFGIGCQNIVADILAGIIMVFEGVACAGDRVSYNGQINVIQTIGIRTTKLKWFGEITIVRNNEFKNYISLPENGINRVLVDIAIDLKESLTRVEAVIKEELPRICDSMRETMKEDVRVEYRGVQVIEGNGIRLSFAIFCKGKKCSWSRRVLNRELLLMCERNGIRLAMPQIVLNGREQVPEDADSYTV